MKIIKSENYVKISGKKERGKRDGTGPFEDSFRNRKNEKGKRKNRGEECPCEDDIKKAQIDPRDIDPETNQPYSNYSSPSLQDNAPNEDFTERGEQGEEEYRIRLILEEGEVEQKIFANSLEEAQEDLKNYYLGQRRVGMDLGQILKVEFIDKPSGFNTGPKTMEDWEIDRENKMMGSADYLRSKKYPKMYE